MTAIKPGFRFLRSIFPLLLWMILMFYASTDFGSSAHTRPIIDRVVYALAGNASPLVRERINYDLRKCAHVTEYAILALLVSRAFAQSSRGFRHRFVVLPLLFGIAFAASDEFHQSFVPSRTGVAADIVFDSFGVVIGVLLSLWRRCADIGTECEKSRSENGPMR